MKKILPYILIFLIFVQLFAPFTVRNDSNNNLKIQNNYAEATTGFLSEDLGIKLSTQASVTDHTINLGITVTWKTNTWLSSEEVYVYIKSPDNTTQVQKVDLTPSGQLIQTSTLQFPNLKAETTHEVIIKASQDSKSLLAAWTNLVAIVPQTVGTWIGANELPLIGVFFEKSESTGVITNSDNPYIITTLPEGSTTPQEVTLEDPDMMNEAATLPLCALDNLGGCVGIILYRLVFQPSAYIFAITGKILDYTFFYTIQDTSYRSQFIVEGWGIVKDFCNMFFIFVLLYVAFGTILNLSGVKTKEMIINIIIIGLLINFSLFATQVIIDASNILARVFYNQIMVGNKVDGKVVEELGLGGSKKLTEALVKKINPQKIIMKAGEAKNITPKGVSNSGTDEGDGSVDNATFIMVTILASIMNLVGLWVFLMVSMVFIARVIGLWLAMILAPIAFFSYTIPQMKDMEMVGWTKWWPETLKLAFLAPVFIFFLYLIIQFLDSGLGVIDSNGKTGVNFFIAIIVPFAFLMVLLMKAKDITTEMSGKIGGAITGAMNTVGGMALGAGLAVATGGAAMALRGTVGKAGNALAESKFAKTNGALGRGLGSVGKWAGSGSMDVRGVKIAGKNIESASGLKVGKAKEGGYTKYKAEVQEKREKRAKSLEVGHDEHEMHDLHEKEETLQTLKNASANDLAALQGKIDSGGTDAREKKERAEGLEKIVEQAGIQATAQQKADAISARDEANKAAADLFDNKNKKAAIRTGGIDPRTGEYRTSNGKRPATKTETDNLKALKDDAETKEGEAATAERKATKDAADNSLSEAQKDLSKATAEQARAVAEQAKGVHKQTQNSINAITGKTINELEFEEVPEAKHKISKINSERKNAYAGEISNRWFNTKANKHAAHNIRMNSEIKSEVKGH